MQRHEAYVSPGRIVGRRDGKIYGHFLEHFHRQIYGGIYEPGSALADGQGFRTDVAAAMRRIQPAILRWPGGCYVSAHHWKDGVGPERVASFDKAWRVEESNRFGTDEYIAYCRLLGVEPYICTNAGSGTQEEMSDWVEYCNLRNEGRWAKLRIANGHPEPYGVKYWSIGNENYYPSEIGAKTVSEWGRYVREAAKMMKRVDPTIELLAASTSDLDWNINLLREAGDLLDWISIHDYWDPLWEKNNLQNYETCMAKTLQVEEKIAKTRHILGALGHLGRIRIAFDEWNLRGWHHPHVNARTEDFLTPRNLNDLNESYTMADAVFTACFLNACLRNCDIVGMANFAPSVNTRGCLFTHPDGLVLRSTYHVFDLYANSLGDTVVDLWMPESESFDVSVDGKTVVVPALDMVATMDSTSRSLRIAVVNRHPDTEMEVCLNISAQGDWRTATVRSVCGETKDAYNDVRNPEDVRILETTIARSADGKFRFMAAPHAVHVVIPE